MSKLKAAYSSAIGITNSTKAKLIVAVNAGLALASGFGLWTGGAQKDALVVAAVNAVLALFVHSPKKRA